MKNKSMKKILSSLILICAINSQLPVFAEQKIDKLESTEIKVTPNVILKGKLDPNKPLVYLITIPDGGQDGYLKFVFKPLVNDPNFKANLHFYNTKNIELENKIFDKPNQIVWKVPVTPERKYYLKLDNNGSNTEYTSSINFINIPDKFEPNNNFVEAKTIDLGTTSDLYIFSGYGLNKVKDSDIDFFKFKVIKKVKIKVNIQNRSNRDKAQNFTVTLFNSNQKEIGKKIGKSDISDLNALFNVDNQGIYYLKIEATNNSAAPSLLTISSQ